MVKKDHFKLLQARNFSETMNDTFKFIRLNFKVMIQTHLMISLPIILVTAGIFLLIFRDQFSLVRTIDVGPFADNMARDQRFTQFMINMLFSSLAILPVSTVTAIIIHRYQQRTGDEVTPQEVWADFKSRGPKIMLAKMLILPLIYLPSILFLLPGLAFYTLFLLMELLILQHDFSIIRALRRSFTIMQKVFWQSFWINLAMIVLLLLISMMLAVPAAVIAQWREITSVTSNLDDPWTILLLSLRVFNQIVGYVLYSLPMVVAGIQYFSIREQLAGREIMERIMTIGQTQPAVNVYEEDEQY